MQTSYNKEKENILNKVARESKYSWLVIGNDLCLQIGKSMSFWVLEIDGDYLEEKYRHVIVYPEGQPSTSKYIYSLEESEEFVECYVDDDQERKRYSLKESGWRKNPVSPAQKRLLSSLGILVEDGISCGEASNILGYELVKRPNIEKLMGSRKPCENTKTSKIIQFDGGWAS